MNPEAHCSACGRQLPRDSRAAVCPACELTGALASSPWDPSGQEMEDGGPAGPVRIGDYELAGEIARGGMGVVYRARQVSLNRPVAFKMILAGEFAGPRFVQRFRAEAEAAARLQHPNIVTIHEIGEHEGRHFFSMDLVEGPNLQEALRRQPFSPTEAGQCVRTLAGAIHYAHEQGVLHRDLKPSNVLLAPSGEPKITDFGLAKVLTSDTELTVSGQVLGTPNYLPPEQASGRRGAVGRWSDVYGLGAILYHLLTARPPFQAQELSDILEQVLHHEPVAPRLLNPALSRDLETICLKCLRKEPRQRYGSALELAEDLDRFLKHEPIRARPVSTPGKLWRWCRRKPALAGALTACGVALLAGVFGISWQWSRAESEGRVARRSLYESDMLLAQQAYEDSHFGRVEELLLKHDPRNTGRPGEDLRGWEWHHLWGQIQSDEIFTLGSHSNTVWFLQFSPDGNTLASVSNYGVDNDVRVWDRRAGTPVVSLPLACFVRGLNVAFSADSRTLAVANGPEVKFYRAPDWAAAERRLTFTNEVIALAYSPDGTRLAVAERERPGPLRVFDTESWEEAEPAPAGPWNLAAYSPDGRYLALNSVDTPEVVLWDRIARIVAARFAGPGGWTRYAQLAFAPNGKVLAVVVANYEADRVDFWAIPEFTKIRSLEKERSTFSGVAFSADSRFAYLSSTDQTVGIYEVATGRLIDSLQGHRDEVWCVAMAPDGQSLATGSRDETIRFWPARTEAAEPDELRLPESTRQLYLSPDGTRLLTVSTDDRVHLWNTTNFERLAEHPLPIPSIRAYSDNKFVQVALDPRSDRVVIGDTPEKVKLWELSTLRETMQFTGLTSRVSGLALSPDGRKLAASGRLAPYRTLIWEASTGTQLDVIPELPSNAGMLRFSPRQTHLALRLNEADAWGPEVALWNLAQKRMERVLSKRRHRVTDLDFSPDERFLATSGEDALICVWDLRSGARIRDLTGPLSRFTAVAWSPDGKRLAAGGIDGTLTLWNTESYQSVGRFKAHPDRVLDVVFLEDGKTVVSVSLASLRVWRAPALKR
ncbi:MAG: protein kinase [Verrucomicrobiales bacterium]|nr:protein kinase [Verrucomicrobiales bacterium]